MSSCGSTGPAKKRKVGAGKAAKAAVDAAMAAADPEQAAANKAAEKGAKAAARRAKAAAKAKGNKAAESGPSGNSNMWGPFEAPSDEEMDPEALVKSKVHNPDCQWTHGSPSAGTMLLRARDEQPAAFALCTAFAF